MRIKALLTILLLSGPLFAQAPSKGCVVSIELAPTSVLAHQRFDLKLAVENRGKAPLPELERASLVGKENFLVAKLGGAEDQRVGAWAMKLAPLDSAGRIPALHPGERFVIPVTLRLPESFAGYVGMVSLQWVGRTGILEGQRSEETRLTTMAGEKPIAHLGTSEGTISLELWPSKAPNTVANFLKLSNAGFYDGLPVHRIVPNGLFQTGLREGKPGYRIPLEVNDVSFKKGVVGMARKPSESNSADSQFFIMLRDVPSLDNQYCAFGKIVAGQPVADVVGRVPVVAGKPSREVVITGVSLDLPKGYAIPEKIDTVGAPAPKKDDAPKGDAKDKNK